MNSGLYSQFDLAEIDHAVYKIMRASSVQEAVEILLPDDPPRYSSEYDQAAKIFLSRILKCQPNYSNTSLKPQDAYRVFAPIPPLPLIGFHARVATLSLALGYYSGGLGYVVGLQETACQFADDNILTTAAKLGFAISTLVIPIKPEAKTLYDDAAACMIPLSKRGEPCTESHSPAARKLCIDLYMILQDFAMLHGKDDAGLKFLHIKASDTARDIDNETNRKFRMKEWVDETFGRLGFSSIVRLRV